MLSLPLPDKEKDIARQRIPESVWSVDFSAGYTKLRAVEKLPELLDMIIPQTERLAETADETASKTGEMIGDTKVTVGVPELAPQFMTCPSCGEKGQWLNLGSHHRGACNDCEVKWPIGANLLPSWLDESEEDWD
jgi:hypothetical protein